MPHKKATPEEEKGFKEDPHYFWPYTIVDGYWCDHHGKRINFPKVDKNGYPVR